MRTNVFQSVGFRSIVAAAAVCASFATHSLAVVITPSNVFMSAYHATRLGNAGVPETRANAFTIMTNGVVARDAVDRIDTWNSDNLGATLDFVGLEYAAPSRFDSIVIEQGTQFGDGGDWESTPKVYILKDPVMVGDTVEPNSISNWVPVTGATTTHVFPPDTTGAVAGQIVFDLSAVSAADRTGWGWAVGGVDGNDSFNFISLTEAWAEGVTGVAAPVAPPLLNMEPINIVSTNYNSVGRNGDGLAHDWNHSRGQTFASVTNGLLDNVVGLGNDGYDDWNGDSAGTITDFAGLIYRGANRFDTLTVNLGNQFGDGGDWEAPPRVFILINPVDTNTTSPESDPTNWRELTGALETTGHVFNPIVTPGPGSAVTFDLTGIAAALRTGYGWAIGGVDGNHRQSDLQWNFISVTELSATGQVIPEPTTWVLLSLAVGINGLLRRRRGV